MASAPANYTRVRLKNLNPVKNRSKPKMPSPSLSGDFFEEKNQIIVKNFRFIDIKEEDKNELEEEKDKRANKEKREDDYEYDDKTQPDLLGQAEETPPRERVRDFLSC